jgi:hypothetical protein
MALILAYSSFYLSSDRDILAHNIPGSVWYRFPAAAVALKMCNREIEAVASEGELYQRTGDAWIIEDSNVVKVGAHLNMPSDLD